MGRTDRSSQEAKVAVDIDYVERRISRRYVTDTVIEIWIPRKGVLGRAKGFEVPVADMSMFGSSVYANKGTKLAKGQVIEITIAGQKTAAIVRSERSTEDEGFDLRFGLEFIKPTEAFLSEVRLITEACRRSVGEDIRDEQLWLRSS